MSTFAYDNSACSRPVDSFANLRKKLLLRAGNADQIADSDTLARSGFLQLGDEALACQAPHHRDHPAPQLGTTLAGVRGRLQREQATDLRCVAGDAATGTRGLAQGPCIAPLA